MDWQKLLLYKPHSLFAIILSLALAAMVVENNAANRLWLGVVAAACAAAALWLFTQEAKFFRKK